MAIHAKPSRFRGSILGALLALLVLGAAAPAGARPLYGVQGVSGGQDTARTVADVARADRAGLKVVRVQAFWAGLEPFASGERDPAALASVDRVVAEASKRKIKVVLFAVGTPCWDSTAPAAARGDCSKPTRSEVYRFQPVSFEPFVSFSTFLVQRYRRSLAGYEIWNEPDQSNENYWAGPNKAARYTAMVKSVYAPLKAVAPEVPVLAGSFVGTNGKWLQAMYDNGAKGSYDGLAVHFYDVPLYGLAHTRAVQRANGDAAPLWLTEYGSSSCYERGGPAARGGHRCVTQAQQARDIADVVNAIARTSYVKAAILYTLRDENRDFRFGLLDLRGRFKPAYARLRHELRGRLRHRPTQRLRVRAAGGRLVLTGTASRVELLDLSVRKGGSLRLTATVAADRFGHFRAVLPKVVPTSGVVVRLRGQWTKRTTTARR